MNVNDEFSVHPTLSLSLSLSLSFFFFLKLILLLWVGDSSKDHTLDSEQHSAHTKYLTINYNLLSDQFFKKDHNDRVKLNYASNFIF